MTTQGPPPPDGAKLDLLATSYKEILDATKHQDDKIGRLLTAISFLTAASLAIASQVHLTTRFAVGDRRLPLFAYAVGAFVVGIVLAVSMLLSSLTTSLTLPGSAPPTGRTWDDRPSLVYFYSIARIPKEEWVARWRTETAEQLTDALRRDYEKETYNLAQRTNHKYARTNEAVAALSLAFFALGVAFVLGLSIATTSSRVDGAVPLTTAARGALAAFVLAYVAIQVRAARRQSLLREWTRGLPRDDAERADDERRHREFGVYQYAVPLIVAALVAAGPNGFCRAVAAAVVAAALVAVARVIRERQRRGLRLVLLAVAAVVLLGSLLWVEETWRLLAAAGVPALLTARSFVEVVQRSGPPAPKPPPPEGQAVATV